MIARKIGEDGTTVKHRPRPALIQSVTGTLHHHILPAIFCKTRKQFLQGGGIGHRSGGRCGRFRTDVGEDCGQHAAAALTGNREKMTQQQRGGGLAVGPRNAVNAELFCGITGGSLTEDTPRQKRIGHRCRSGSVVEPGFMNHTENGTILPGILQIVVTVKLRTADRAENRTGSHIGRPVGHKGYRNIAG